MRLRLAIELVPRPIWATYANLLHAVRPATWDRLRHKVYDAADLRCQACGARGRLHCHERWQYNDKTGVARLKGFRALCSACHAVCHPGSFFARMLKRGGVYAVAGGGGFRAMDPKTGFALGPHWCKVNGLDLAAWERHEAEAWATWERRGQRSWRVDLGRWADLVPAERRRGRRLLPKDRWPRRRRDPGSERFGTGWLWAKAPPVGNLDGPTGSASGLRLYPPRM